MSALNDLSLNAALKTPRDYYAESLQKEGFQADAAQAQAVEKLDVLWHQLVAFKRKRKNFLIRWLADPAVPKGLYLWGGVGRGKSFLMDTFFQSLPLVRKKRVHFHHFMAEIHRQLGALQNETDPLLKVAERIAKKTRVLCFDEFHVSDIADAMILQRLLSALFENGVVMVATSNYAPNSLYPNGLQRDRFLPAIALLESHLQVVNVDGGLDYRLRDLSQAALYLTPLSTEAEVRLGLYFNKMANGQDEGKKILTVQGRRLPIVKVAGDVVWFDFYNLCATARSQQDYLEIAKRFHTVLVSGIPQLGVVDAAAARRLTWLVDVLYDHRVKLIVSAAVAADDLYLAGDHAEEFFRTASRLTEMQSHAYLAEAHHIDDFQFQAH